MMSSSSSCLLSLSYRGYPPGLLLWSVRQVQRARPRAAGSEPRGPLRPVRPQVRAEDGDDDRNPAGECVGPRFVVLAAVWEISN